jgi:small subunit ribosomal protein S20
MAHSKQALKRIRTNEKSRQANKSTRSAMRTAVKKAAKTAQPEDLAKAMKKLDKAAKKGVIHRNAAARKKSRLARAANKKAAAAS